MIFFVVFNLYTGFVLRTGVCQEHMLTEQAGAGEGVIHSDDLLAPNDWRVELETQTVLPVGE